MKLSFILIAHLLLAGSAYAQYVIEDASKPLKVNVSGRDGEDGDNGSTWGIWRAECDDEGNITRRGDDGNNGEDGEDGEDGKNIVVHYQNISQLKNLKLISYGGRGGEGGYGSEGGDGCNFTYRGAGRDGHDGDDGQDGDDGSLYLVPRPLKYIPRNNKKSAKIKDLINKSILLNTSIWDSSNGARSLLKDGSYVRDRYYILSKNIKREVKISWEAGKDIERYLDVDLSIRLEAEQVKVSFPDTQIEYDFEIENEVVTIIIKSIYTNSEIFDLDYDIEGIGSQLRIIIKRKNDTINFNELDGYLRINKYSKLFNGKKRIHNQDRIEDYFEIRNDQLIIKIGEMAFKKRHKKAGRKLEVYIRFLYSVGDKKIDKIVSFHHIVGNKFSWDTDFDE